MSNKNEIVQRIKSHYVGDDCVQVMVPYQNELTIINKDGIIYQHENDSHISINKYVDDERRFNFPYSNIPTHCGKVGLFKKMNFTNQLLNYEEPYISLSNDAIIESFAIKDNDEALIINKFMVGSKKTVYKTRKELEEIFMENQNKLILYLVDDSISTRKYYPLPSEEQIYSYIRNEMIKHVDEFKHYMKVCPGSSVSQYLHEHPLFLKFVEQSAENFDLKNMEFNLNVVGGEALIIDLNESDMSIRHIKVSFISLDSYKVDITNIPTNKYTIEQLKYLSPIIVKTREPKIPLRLNPGVTKEDIKKAKQMIKTLKK